MKTPTQQVYIAPLKADGTMTSWRGRKWKPGDSLTYEQRVAYCIKNAGPKQIKSVLVTNADGTVFARLNGKGIEEAAVVELPKAPKVKKPRKPKAQRIQKAPGSVGHTKANELKLPNRAGVANAIQDILARANPLSDKGWTAREVLAELKLLFPGRPTEGMLITLRAQISRGFNAERFCKKERDGREVRYSL